MASLVGDGSLTPNKRFVGDPHVNTSTTPTPDPALFPLNQCFNMTKTGAGAAANASGSVTGGINVADANWGVSWTTKRTTGKLLTKIMSTVTADGYGAVAAWPFVGKIYSQTQSATSPSGANNWTFSRGGHMLGLIAYVQIDCKSFEYTNSGSFQLP